MDTLYWNERFDKVTHGRGLVAFSDRCEFKDVYVTKNAIVTHYSQVSRIASDLLHYNTGVSLNAEMVFNRLYPYTQTPEAVKQQHIADIHYGEAVIRSCKAYAPSFDGHRILHTALGGKEHYIGPSALFTMKKIQS